jgi:hypothetical protein
MTSTGRCKAEQRHVVQGHGRLGSGHLVGARQGPLRVTDDDGVGGWGFKFSAAVHNSFKFRAFKLTPTPRVSDPIETLSS